jgi:hypothetical protein
MLLLKLAVDNKGLPFLVPARAFASTEVASMVRSKPSLAIGLRPAAEVYELGTAKPILIPVDYSGLREVAPGAGVMLPAKEPKALRIRTTGSFCKQPATRKP